MAISTTEDSTMDVTFDWIRYKQSLWATGICMQSHNKYITNNKIAPYYYYYYFFIITQNVRLNTL